MVKRIAGILLAAVLLCCMAFAEGGVSASDGRRVYDYADLLSSSEEEALQASIDGFIKDTGYDFVFLTTDDDKGMTTENYADVFYDDGGFGTGDDWRGMLYYIDMYNRELYILTDGQLIRVINDSRLDALLDAAYDGAASDDYARSAQEVLDLTAGYCRQGIQEGQYNYDSQTGEIQTDYYNTLTQGELVTAGLAGGAAALVLWLAVRSRYKLLKSTYRYDVRENARSVITGAKDRYIRTSVRTVAKQQNSGGRSGGSFGGGSATHSSFSGSGHSHGGGGRKF